MIDAQKELEKLGAGRSVARPRREKAGGAATLTLRLAKSGICAPRGQKATLRALGLRRVGQRVVRPDVPGVRGMVHKVRHLVEVVRA